MRIVKRGLQISERLGGELFELEEGRGGGREGGEGRRECMIAGLLIIAHESLFLSALSL
jgi:hypothetical protein